METEISEFLKSIGLLDFHCYHSEDGISWEFYYNNTLWMVDYFETGDLVLLKDGREPETWDFQLSQIELFKKTLCRELGMEMKDA